MEIKDFKGKLIESSIGNVFVYILNILFPVIAGKFYGFTGAGEYTYGLSLVMMTMYLATLGLGTGLLYFIPKEGKKYVSFSFAVNAAASLIIIMGLWFIVDDWGMRMMFPLVWLMSAEQLFFSIFRAKQKINQYFKINLGLGLLLKTVLTVVFYYIFGAKFGNMVAATYISLVLSLIFYYICQRDMFGKIVYSKRVLAYSIPLVIGTIMAVLMSQIDILMIRKMMGAEDVQVYNLAAKIATFPSLFLLIVNTIFPPIVADLYHRKEMDKLRNMYKKTARGLFALSSTVIIFMIIFKTGILNLCGEGYLRADKVLIYRGIGQVINASVGSVWYIIAMTGRSKTTMMGQFAAAIINSILNFILIPKMGIDGAALASMITVGFVNILGYSIVSRILKVKVYGII